MGGAQVVQLQKHTVPSQPVARLLEESVLTERPVASCMAGRHTQGDILSSAVTPASAREAACSREKEK